MSKKKTTAKQASSKKRNGEIPDAAKELKRGGGRGEDIQNAGSGASVGSHSVESFRGPRIFAKKGTYVPGACSREEATHREEDAEHEAASGDWHHAASNWEAAAKGWNFYSSYGFSSQETERESRAHGEAGKCEFYNGNYTLAIEFFRRQLASALEATSWRPQAVAKARQNLAMAIFYNGSTDEALRQLQEAADSLSNLDEKDEGDRLQLRSIISASGVIRQTCGNYTSALTLHQDDFKMSAADNDGIGKYRALTNTGICHMGQGHVDLAFELFEEALLLSRCEAAGLSVPKTLHFDQKDLLPFGPIGGVQNTHELTWRALFHVALASYRLGNFDKTLQCVGEAEEFVKKGRITQLFKSSDNKAAKETQALKVEETAEQGGYNVNNTEMEEGEGLAVEETNSEGEELEQSDSSRDETNIVQADVHGPPPQVDANTNAMIRSQFLLLSALCHVNRKRSIRSNGQFEEHKKVARFADPDMTEAAKYTLESLRALSMSPAPCDLNRASALKIHGELLLTLGNARSGTKTLDEALDKLRATMPHVGSRQPSKKVTNNDKSKETSESGKDSKKKKSSKDEFVPSHLPNIQLMQPGTLLLEAKKFEKIQKQEETSYKMSSGIGAMGGLGLGLLMRTSPANSNEAPPSQKQLRVGMDRLTEALEVASHQKERLSMAKLNGCLATVKYLMNLKGEAAEHLDTALSLARKVGDFIQESIILRCQADIQEIEGGPRAALDGLLQYFKSTLRDNRLVEFEADACKRLVSVYTMISNEPLNGGENTVKLSLNDLVQMGDDEVARREREDDLFLVTNARNRALRFHKQYMFLVREWFALPSLPFAPSMKKKDTEDEDIGRRTLDPIELARLGLEVEKAANKPP